MSSGCGDVVSLEDMQIAKKHQTFEAEVITGKAGGLASGADIDYATNQVTGQVQKTLPAILRDAGFRPASFTFTTGGTLTVNDADLAVLWPIADGGDGNYYAWKGSLPKIIPAGSTPADTGGVSSAGWLAFGDITLRNELNESEGISIVGGSSFNLDYFSNAILTNEVKSNVIITSSHSSATRFGGAKYIKDGTTGAPSTGNEGKFYNADGVGWILSHEGKVSCAVFGVVGDRSNETLKVQRWLDYCRDYKAKAFIPEGFNVGILGVVINNSHENLELESLGGFYFFGDGATQTNQPAVIQNSGASCALYLHGCIGLRGNIRVDGGRSSKVLSEYVHSIGMFGGINNHLTLDFTETRGDGIYVNYYTGNVFVSSSSSYDGFPTNLKLTVTSTNSSPDGRNAVSLICYKGCEVSGYSYYHGDDGYNIGKMPGGLDIEPNQSWQACYDLIVPSWIATASGSTGGFGIVGKSSPGELYAYCVRGVKANVEVTTIPNPAQNTQHYGVLLNGARDVEINLVSKYLNNPTNLVSRCCGIQAANLANFQINAQLMRTPFAADIGIDDIIGLSNPELKDGTFNISGHYWHTGVLLGAMQGVDVNVKAGVFSNMGYAGDRGLVQYRRAFYSGSYQITNCSQHNLSVSCTGDTTTAGALVYGIRCNTTNPVTFTYANCLIDNSDLSFITHNGTTFNRMDNTVNLSKGRIVGVTWKDGDDAISGPSIWHAGDKIWHKEPTLTYVGKVFNGTAWKNFGALV